MPDDGRIRIPWHDPNQSLSELLDFKRRDTDAEVEANKAAKSALTTHRRQIARHTKGTSPLQAIIDKLIGDGLELKCELLKRRYVPRRFVMSTAKQLLPFYYFPDDHDTTELRTTSRGWARRAKYCFEQWWGSKFPTALARITRLESIIEPGLTRIQIDRCVADLLDDVRSIVPKLKIVSLDASQAVLLELTGDELDHAEQLLAIPGCHEDAILRAAGIIAGVVLERHLKNVALGQARGLPPSQQPPFLKSKPKKARRKSRPGIMDYVNWLRGQEVITQPVQKKLGTLASIRTCCAHPPTADGTITPPKRHQVQELIDGARRYTRDIKMPAVPAP